MKIEKVNQASPDTTDHISLSKRDRQLFEIREDSLVMDTLLRGAGRCKALAEQKKKNRNYFEGRNVIKKVKIHCLKVFYGLIKDCIDIKAYGLGEFKLKLVDMNMVYQTFKYDISKYRNKVLLDLRMKDIMLTFSNVNITEDSTKIKEDKQMFFNFLMNCTWLDFLLFVKHGCNELFVADDPLREISEENIRDYINYVQKSSNRYKDRANLDDGYLRLYDKILGREVQTTLYSVTREINEFILTYNGV
jgi:hypothetical protein